MFDNLQMASVEQEEISIKALPVCMIIKYIRKREIPFPHPAFSWIAVARKF